MNRLQRDERRRLALSAGWEIYRAAVDDGTVGEQGIDQLAACMQELEAEGLIAYGTQSLGAALPTIWNGAAIQQLHNWRVTAAGRRDAQIFLSGAPEESVPASDHAARTADIDPAPPAHDVFIAHASEDKGAVAHPLAQALKRRGWTVWLDDLELTVGDSLTGLIDQGLARSRFGVVVLSPEFFAKRWSSASWPALPRVRWHSGQRSFCRYGTPSPPRRSQRSRHPWQTAWACPRIAE